MRVITQIAIAVGAFALGGCASIQPVAQQPASQTSEHRFEKNYAIGAEKTAYVGQPLVRVKDYWELTSTGGALVADRNATLRLPPFITVEIPKDSTARVVGKTERNGATLRVAVIQAPNAAALRFLLNDDGTFEGSAINYMGQRMGFSYRPDPPDLHFLENTVVNRDTTKGWTNFELVYSGATKDSLNLLYREYTPQDLARPAFTQNLTYDRNSASLRFREVQISVLSADNEAIRYVVQADGM